MSRDAASALGGLSDGVLAGQLRARGALTVAAIGSIVVVGLGVSAVSSLRALPTTPKEEPVTA
jgi:hypothetical protein